MAKTTVTNDVEMEKKWQAESDCRTLVAACELRKDKKRFDAALVEAKKQKHALDWIVEEKADGDEKDYMDSDE